MKDLIQVPNTHLSNITRAIVLGLEVSSGARATSTYYHSKNEQIDAVKAKVLELREIDKTLPILLANMQGATRFFLQETITAELKGGSMYGACNIIKAQDWFDIYQDNALWQVFSKLPITYILRMYEGFIGQFNNARTQRYFLQYIYTQKEYQWLKYRKKINNILRYVYGVNKYNKLLHISQALKDNSPINNEDRKMFDRLVTRYSEQSSDQLIKQLLFVSHKLKEATDGPIGDYFKAMNGTDENEFFSIAGRLDESVVMGIISSGSNPLFASFFETIEGEKKLKESVKKLLAQNIETLTDEQSLRRTKRDSKVGVSRAVKAENVSAEAIQKTKIESNRNVSALEDRKAIIDRIELPYEKIAIIVDNSDSLKGDRDSKNTNKALIEHLKNVLLKSASATCVHTTGNNTNFSESFVEIAKSTNLDLDALFVLSDGYENAPYEGALNELIKIAFDKKGVSFPVIHCNPMVSAEMKAQARNMGDCITTIAVNNPAQIEIQMNAKLLELNPRVYLEREYAKLLNLENPVEA